MTEQACEDCAGTRAVLDDYAEDGYGPCPACVVDAGQHLRRLGVARQASKRQSWRIGGRHARECNDQKQQPRRCCKTKQDEFYT